MAKALVTQPNYDYTTRYISVWAQKAVDLAKDKGVSVVCLKEARANKKVFESVLRKTQPKFVFINGHGDERCVTGQDGEVLVKVGVNEDILNGSIVYALSCKSAKILGKKSITRGAYAYLGYEEDFIFLYDERCRTNPKIDKTAKLFLDPAITIPISLIKGHSTGQASGNSQNEYQKTITSLLSSEASSEQRAYLGYLVWDMRSQVCLGDQNAVI